LIRIFKYSIYLFAICRLGVGVSYAQTEGAVTIEGIFKGENLYIENPIAESGVGFCVSEIMVNDFTTTDEINSSFFEIDLGVYGFKFGDHLKVTIKHKPGCEPRILNKEVLTPFSTFVLKSMTIDASGMLKWTTTGESGSLPFIIEQFRWNKWVRVGSVQGKGTPAMNTYYFKLDFHSGLNRFRIKQIGADSKAKYTENIEFESTQAEINFIPGNAGKTADMIFFSEASRFEIYDYYGNLIKTGTGNDIDVRKLKPGTYFLNYDNKTETFIKK
jgi:hypothetical protein